MTSVTHRTTLTAQGLWTMLVIVTTAIVVSGLRDDTLSARAAAQKAAADAPTAEASSTYKDVYEGWKWWHVYCYRCHGTDAIGGSLAPNLIDTNRAMTAPVFLKTVREGVPDSAMQAWGKLLSNQQIRQIHLYVRARAEKLLPRGRPDEVGPNQGKWVPPAGWPAKK